MQKKDKDVNHEERDTATVANQSNGPQVDIAKKQLGPRPMQAWDDIVGQRIAQAMQEGEFDNLPGKGKPQRLGTNPYAGDNHLAFDIMANNDVTPGWVTRRANLFKRIDKFRSDIREEVMAHQLRRAVVSSHQNKDELRSSGTNALASFGAAQIAAWKAEVSEINQQVRDVNIEQPVSDMEVFPLQLSDELAKASAGSR